MKFIRKGLIGVHRYLGIALSLLFVVWFVSGIGMMFAGGMPRLNPREKLYRESTIDLSQIKFTPSRLLGEERTTYAGTVSVRSLLGRPVYHIDGQTIFADDGTVLDGIDKATALKIAGEFLGVANPPERTQHTFLTESDQWTLTERRLPLHKITVNDGTELYVSAETGEVVQKTTRGSRALAWVAAIPHWFYFKSLRANQPVWFQVVCWTAGIGCVLALAGITLSFTQLKIRRPFRLLKISSYIPYSGWMRWHYIAGAVFGVLTFTWVFSGLLSMEPWGWAAGPTLEGDLRGELRGGPLNPGEFPAIDAAAWKQILPDRQIKEVDYARIQGDPYFVVRTAPPSSMAIVQDFRDRPHQPYYSQSGVDPDRVLIYARTMQVRPDPFSVESMMSRVKQTWPDVPVVESTLLTSYDSYYYSRDGQRPLPVLRVKFDDPVQTWIYIDATMSRQVAAVHRLDRFERWIYNGFHSLDFSFWYYNPPVWYSVVIVLSLGGIAVSLLGMYLGFMRMGRGAKRLVGVKN
ncbi:MAG TPA: PepSY domain-containing protein [Terriglobia bacterium]|nr:PepSY domain-containing protein [Terriglobia bacterium]